MAKEVKQLQNNPKRSVDTHKTPALGVSRPHWFVAEVRPTMERKVRDLLTAQHYEAYIPSQVKTTVYKNYTRHTSERPVIPGVVFVRITEDQVRPVAALSTSIYRFMPNRALQRDDNGALRFAFISEDEMNQLKYICGQAENPVLFSDEPLKVGQRVRVMRGPLAGVEGFFMESGNSTCIVVKVSIGRYSSVRTEVSKDDVQPVDGAPARPTERTKNEQ